MLSWLRQRVLLVMELTWVEEVQLAVEAVVTKAVEVKVAEVKVAAVKVAAVRNLDRLPSPVIYSRFRMAKLSNFLTYHGLLNSQLLRALLR
jgi:hypothetical protein|tara:strand:- start:665 stop:937 length:273 start_codon:yes stop_codon:yes gene_type:complete